MSRRRPRSERALTLPEAAAAVDLSVSTLRRHIRRGRLRAQRIRGKYGEEYRITPAALAALGLPVRLPPRHASALPAPEPAARPVTNRAVEQLAGELAALRRELGRLRGAVVALVDQLASVTPSHPVGGRSGA